MGFVQNGDISDNGIFKFTDSLNLYFERFSGMKIACQTGHASSNRS